MSDVNSIFQMEILSFMIPKSLMVSKSLIAIFVITTSALSLILLSPGVFDQFSTSGPTKHMDIWVENYFASFLEQRL